MKSKYRNIALVCLFCMTYSLKSWAGEISRVMRHSPANPAVGQTVTFTVSSSNIYSCEVVKVAPDLVNLPATLLNMTLIAGNWTATHTYAGPGTYRVGYDISPNPICQAIRRPTGSNRALQFFEFGPVDGTLVPSNIGSVPSNTQAASAPLTIIASAPIPTMGQWGLLTLGLLSLIFGVVMINQKYFKVTDIKQ